MKHIKRNLWMAGVIILALAACTPKQETPVSETPVPATAVIAEGHIFPVKYTTLSFLARGILNEMDIKLGDSVKAGEELLRLDNAELAEAEVVAARQAYDLLLRNASGDHAQAWQAYMNAQKVREAAQVRWNDINLRDIENRIEDRQEDLADRLADLEKARTRFEQYKDRGRDDANYKDAEDDLDHRQSDYDEAWKDLEATRRERDVPRANLDAALADEAEAKYQYELGLEGPNTDQLSLVKARLAAAEETLSNYVITAPFDGTVMNINVSAGELVGPEGYAIKLADTSAWYVKTSDLTELEVVRISLGQPVTIVPDALPEVTLKGKVTAISQAGANQAGDVLYEVEIKLDSIDPRLLWGMTVEVTFETTD